MHVSTFAKTNTAAILDFRKGELQIQLSQFNDSWII